MEVDQDNVEGVAMVDAEFSNWKIVQKKSVNEENVIGMGLE